MGYYQEYERFSTLSRMRSLIVLQVIHNGSPTASTAQALGEERLGASLRSCGDISIEIAPGWHIPRVLWWTNFGPDLKPEMTPLHQVVIDAGEVSTRHR